MRVFFFCAFVVVAASCAGSDAYRADVVDDSSAITPLRGDLVATTRASYVGSDVPFAPKRFGDGQLFLFPDHIGFRPSAPRDRQTPSAFPCTDVVGVDAISSFKRPAMVVHLKEEDAVFVFALVDNDRDAWVKLLNDRCRSGGSRFVTSSKSGIVVDEGPPGPPKPGGMHTRGRLQLRAPGLSFDDVTGVDFPRSARSGVGAFKLKRCPWAWLGAAWSSSDQVAREDAQPGL